LEVGKSIQADTSGKTPGNVFEIGAPILVSMLEQKLE
jgi:hypothetical protein